jgi:hypothetical protein
MKTKPKKIKDLPSDRSLENVRFRYPGDGQAYYWAGQWGKGVWGKKDINSQKIFPLSVNDIQQALEWELVNSEGTPMKTKFLVEHLFSYGWDDAGWSSGNKPWLFDTREAAQAEIDDLIESVAEAVAVGDMSDEYDAADYRIVEVDPTTWKRKE